MKEKLLFPCKNLHLIKITTERLLLEPVTIQYAEQILLEYRDPVIQYMNYGPPEGLDTLQSRIKRREVDMKEGIQLFTAVTLKKTGEFIGCFGLEDLDKNSPEMGGWLKLTAHGNHYGQEAAAALKKWADRNLCYNHIIWPCAAVNIPSRKLAESLGGKVQKKYEKVTARGTLWPFVEYWIYGNNVK